MSVTSQRFPGQVSFLDLASVPLRFGLLPPVSQEGLLVVSHAFKLAVGMLWLRVAHFFWTHNALQMKKKRFAVRARRVFYLPSSNLSGKILIFLLMPDSCAQSNSTYGPSPLPLRSRQWKDMGGADQGKDVADTSQPHTTQCWRKKQAPSCSLPRCLYNLFILWSSPTYFVRSFHKVRHCYCALQNKEENTNQNVNLTISKFL